MRCMSGVCELYVKCMARPEIHPTVSGVKCYKALKIENSVEKKNQLSIQRREAYLPRMEGG